MEVTAMWRIATVGLFTLVGMVACEREHRTFHGTLASNATPTVRVTSLEPGPVVVTDSAAGPYAGNAYGMSQGKQLFTQMNCVGCHAHGGGAMGPALMDMTWIYGSNPDQIFATIQEGRPNGMPSFRGKLTNDQIWQLVAYVRSMSGIGRRDVRSGRADEMYGRSSEQNTKTGKPKTTGPASASEMP
jgi:cytochrome c oxidase cbb3-type subunit 3